MSSKCGKLFCETFANDFHDMKGLCAGMTRAAIEQNKKVSILFPVLQLSFVVAEYSYLAKLVSVESVRSLVLGEVEVQRFREDPDTFEWLMRGGEWWRVG